MILVFYDPQSIYVLVNPIPPASSRVGSRFQPPLNICLNSSIQHYTLEISKNSQHPIYTRNFQKFTTSNLHSKFPKIHNIQFTLEISIYKILSCNEISGVARPLFLFGGGKTNAEGVRSSKGVRGMHPRENFKI
jgi:hypothetical protein